MNSGRFNNKVTVQQLKEPENFGQQNQSLPENWKTLFRCWVEDVEQHGRQYRFAQQTHANMTHLLSAMATSETKSMNPGMRVLMGNQVLDVISKRLHGPRKQYIEILCQELVL